MRILIATQHRNLVGGVEKYLQSVMPALAARGHQLGLVYEQHFDPALEPIDPPGIDLPACSTAEAGLDAILRFIAEWKPDVVYSHGVESAQLRSALLNGYPTVLYAHNYFGTCATGQKCQSFPTPQPCSREFGLGCLVLHYPRRCGGLHPGTMWKMFQRSGEMNGHLHQYQAILVASRHMYREYQQHGVTPDRIHLVPLPNPHRAAHDHAPVRTPVRGRILFIGRLTKLKGASYLLRAIPIAAQKLGQPLAVIIAGDGPDRKKLQAFALELGLSAEFTGWIRTSRKVELMHEVDLLAVPSVWPEPFGLVGIEAGAYGLPAVAYSVGGIPDWLISGQSGELAPGDPPTVKGLADAIVRALKDPGHYSKLCSGARLMASRFDLDIHLSALEDILDSVKRESAGIGCSFVEDIHA